MTIFRQAQIENYFKKPDSTIRAVLLYGANEGLIGEYVKSFVKTVSEDINDAFQVTYLNYSDVSSNIGNLFGEYNSQSLMGGKRAIILQNADNNLTKNLNQLFEDSKSNNLLIITAGSLNKSASLVKLAEKEDFFACIPCYEDRAENIYSMAKDFFLKNNITIDRDSMQLLCGRLSNDRKSSLEELEKLITYIRNKKDISIDDIYKSVSDVSASSMDDLCFFTASGDLINLNNTYQKLLNENIEPISMIRSMYYHFEKLLKARSVYDETRSIDKASSSIVPRVIFFRENSFKSQISSWNRDKILRVFELLYDAERECKTTHMPSTDIASYAFIRIAAASKA